MFKYSIRTCHNLDIYAIKFKGITTRYSEHALGLQLNLDRTQQNSFGWGGTCNRRPRTR